MKGVKGIEDGKGVKGGEGGDGARQEDGLGDGMAQARPVKVLLVEDDRGLARLIEGQLETRGIVMEWVGSGGEALAWLGRHVADLLLLDYELPDMTGQAVVESLVGSGRAAPFVLITGQGDERIAVEVMKLGARDYVVKDGAFLDVLPSVVVHVLGQVEQEARLAEAESAFRASEARYRVIFASAMDAVLLVGEGGQVVEANPQACRMFGCTESEFGGLSVRSLLDEEHEHLYEEYLSAMRSGDVFRAETVVVGKDGRRLDVDIQASGLEYQGQRHGLMIIRDMSERKWAEEELQLTNEQLRLSEQALRERESRLRAIFQGSAVGVALVDLEGRLVEVNRALEEMLGTSRGELRQGGLAGLMEASDGAAAARLFEALRSGRQERGTLEVRYRHKNGSLLSVRQTASRVRGGGEGSDYVVNIMEDISERKRAEEALRESEERFRRLSEAAFEAVVIHEEGRIVDANQAFGAMFGCEVAGVIGREVLEFVGAGSREVVAENIRRQTTEVYEVFGRSQDGREFPVEICARMMPYKGRAVRVAAVRDITERRQLEEELRAFATELERSNRDLDSFARLVARNLRRPLGLLADDARHLLQGAGRHLEAEQRQLAERISGEGEQLQRRVEELLAYSRLVGQVLQMGPVDLGEVVSTVQRRLGDALGQAGGRLEAETLPTVVADGRQMEQVLEHLIANALRYRRAEPVVVTVSGEVRQDCWVVRVRDNGRGVAAGEREEIFEMFKAGKGESSGNMGVGLALCKKIVERHGGRIWAESQEGVGSVFCFTIPRRVVGSQKKGS